MLTLLLCPAQVVEHLWSGEKSVARRLLKAVAPFISDLRGWQDAQRVVNRWGPLTLTCTL